jgi:spermidine synthase
MNEIPKHQTRAQSFDRGGMPFLLGVFLICMCGLMLQIVQTRIISVIAYYHLAFFAISMAMLGMTAGSLFVYFKGQHFPPERLFENLAWISAAFSISVFLSTMSLITTIVGSGISNTFIMTAVVWFKLILILLPPYVLAGMAISLALTRGPVPVGVVYGCDLVGAASGCLITLLLLSWADAISVLIAIAAFGAIASVAFASARRVSGDSAPPVSALSGLGRGWRPAALAIFFGAIALGNAAIQPTTQARRHDGLVLLMSKNHTELTASAIVRWNTYSRIMASSPNVGTPALWGPSPTMPAASISQRALDIDGSAGTSMYQFDGDLKKLDFLRYDITNLAYAIRSKGRSAVIGVGGGRDLLSAYLFGFRDVTGVELNSVFIDFLTREFRDYNHLADLPGVRLFVDEARSWFARTNERFDLVEMSLIDTWAATGAGAYSLSENGLYTTQGWHHFLSALTPGGVFTVSRWFNPEDITETGRLISLAAAALREQGADRPEAHLFLASSDQIATLIVAKSAFTRDELATLRNRTESLKFKVQLSPDQNDASSILMQIAKADSSETLANLSARQHLDLSVTTDDRPFFFNQLNALDPASIRFALNNSQGIVHGNVLATMTLLLIMMFSVVLVLFTMIVPALPSVRRVPKALAQSGTLYFVLIGFGFMFVEIGLIQRLSTFLGHPVYGLAIGLFGIILSTGIGSLLSERVPLDSRRRILIWAAFLGGYLISLPLWFPRVVTAFEGGELMTRVGVSLAAIVPSGLLMGFGFPTGMRLVNAVDTRPTPWFWAVNGAAGVLAASVAVATSIAFSINASLWVGAACYLMVAPAGIALASMSSPPSMNKLAVPAIV